MFKVSLFIPSANTDGNLGSARDFVTHWGYRSDSGKDESPCPLGTYFPVGERRREAALSGGGCKADAGSMKE